MYNAAIICYDRSNSNFSVRHVKCDKFDYIRVC